jgi:hypothetical protein
LRASGDAGGRIADEIVDWLASRQANSAGPTGPAA